MSEWAPTRRRHPVASVAWSAAAVAVEVALYRSYTDHDARFHWFTHFFVGGGAALAVMTVRTWRTRRPIATPLLWVVLGHLYAMFPDLLFTMGNIAHRRWMDVFLGHVSTHFAPGQNATWFVVFLAAVAGYLIAADRARAAHASGPSLAVRDWGDGPPVVFLHGLGSSRRYWDALARAGAGYHGLAPDLLGFGRSPHPAHASYDVECHLGPLIPIVPDGAVLVGHSAGAILAAALAAANPERIGGLLLLSPPSFPDADSALRDVGQLGLMARLTVTNTQAGRALCWLMCCVRPLLLPVAPLVIRDVPPSVASDFLRHTWASYSGTLRHVVVEHRLAPDLLATTMPIVVLHGAQDRTVPVGDVEVLVDWLLRRGRSVDLRVVDGDHHLPVRHAAVVADALVGLIATVTARAARPT